MNAATSLAQLKDFEDVDVQQALVAVENSLVAADMKVGELYKAQAVRTLVTLRWGCSPAAEGGTMVQDLVLLAIFATHYDVVINELI